MKYALARSLATSAARGAPYKAPARIYCLVVSTLLFSTISIPLNSAIYPALGGSLEAIPRISVVSEVGNFRLTQARYSTLSLVMPLCAFLLFLLLLNNMGRAARIKIGAIGWGLSVFGLVAFFSALALREYSDGLKLLIYALLIVCYLGFDEQVRSSLRRFLIRLGVFAGLANAIATIWQYAVLAGGSLDINSLRAYRPDGLFGDSILSALCSVVAIAIIAVGRPELPSFYKIAVVALSLISGVLTGSRSFYFLLIIVGVGWVFAESKNLTVATRLMLLGGPFAIILILREPFNHFYIVDDALTTSSARIFKRELALQLFASHPVVGVGTGQYAVAEASLALNSSAGLHGTNPHNVYVQVLSENGVIGFFSLSVALVSVFLRALKREDSLAILLTVIYLAVAYSLGILYSVAFTSFFVALMTGLLSAESPRRKL